VISKLSIEFLNVDNLILMMGEKSSIGNEIKYAERKTRKKEQQ